MGKFEITRGRNRRFSYVLTDDRGEVLLSNDGYTAKHNCIKAVEAVRKNSMKESKFERWKAKGRQYYFTLKAVNGQVVGKSRIYTNVIDRDNGIESVKQIAPKAELLDSTIPIK